MIYGQTMQFFQNKFSVGFTNGCKEISKGRCYHKFEIFFTMKWKGGGYLITELNKLRPKDHFKVEAIFETYRDYFLKYFLSKYLGDKRT